MAVPKLQSTSTRWLSPVLLVLFLAIMAFFLWTEHRAHLLGALPWLLLVACCVLLLIGLRDLHNRSIDNDEAHRRTP